MTKRMLSFLLALVMVLGMFQFVPPHTHAEESNSDESSVPEGLHYVINNGRVIITKYDGNATDIIIPDVIEGYPVTDIGDQAFHNCRSLVHIEIPSSVSYIDNFAFSGCSSLTKVSIPEGVKAINDSTFLNCSNLIAVSIPKSVTRIDSSAFRFCNNLSHILFSGTKAQWNTVLANSAEALGEILQEKTVHFTANISALEKYEKVLCSATYYFKCTICEKLLGSENSKVVHDFVDAEWVPVQEPSCTMFGHYTQKCNRCDYVQEKYVDALGHDYGQWVITQEATTKKEGSKYRICNRCQYKETETIGKLGSVGSGTCGKSVKWYLSKDGTLTINGTGAMKNYTGNSSTAPWYKYHNKIKTVVIQEGVTSIGDFAFLGCFCTSIEIPSTVKTIGKSAFSYSSLKSIVIPEGVTKIGARAFESIEPLKTAEIGKNVTSLGDYAFYMCENLQSVVINGKIKTLNEHTFADCFSLESIQLPKTLTSIGEGAFASCYSLQTVVIPEGTKKIGKKAFDDCMDLRTVSIPKTVTSIASTAFRYCNSLKKIVFCGTKAQWKAFGKTIGKMAVQYHSFVDERCIYCKRKNGPCLVEHVGKEELRNVKQPTCTEKGYTGDVYCTTCGDLVKEGKESPVTHAYVNTVKAPTYTKKGYTEHTCSACGHSYKDKYTDPLGLPKPSVKISVNDTTGKPVITWKSIDEVKQYWVYRATSKDGDYTRVVKTEQTSFEDTTAVAGKKYYYKVRAIGIDDSKSAYSSIVNITCKCIAPVVSASVTASSGNVKLSWESVKSAKTYYIYRAKSADGSYEKIASTTKTYYTDSSAAVGTTYHYKVKAIASSSAANSVYSNILSAKRICAQADLEVKISTTYGKPSLSWDKVSGAKEYKILRAESQNGEYRLLTTTTSTNYTDKTAAFDKDYWYQVDVVGSKTGTDNDTDAAVKVHTTCAKPSVSITISSKKPKVSWKPVEGATKYYVYRATSKSGKYTKVATVNDETSYRDSKAKKGKTYYYKVKAIAANSAANSAYSSVKRIKSK